MYVEEAEAVRAALSSAVEILGTESIYAWGPVFKARLHTESGATVDAVVKPTWSEPAEAAALGRWQRHVNAGGGSGVEPLAPAGVALPVEAAGRSWTAYPWIAGRLWDGSLESLAAAGSALGRQHMVSSTFEDSALPRFRWPEPDPDSVDEDVEAIRAVCAAQGEELDKELEPLGDPGSMAASRWIGELLAFHEYTLPAIRDAGLPCYAVSLDFRAANLIYTAGSGAPVFLDYENGEVAPRLLDLAVSALLFGCEAEANPGRLFTAPEWAAFRDAYLRTAPALTETERQLWPEALRYMRLEWGLWHLTEGAEWDLPGQGGFLRDLLTVQDESRFPLTLR